MSLGIRVLWILLLHAELCGCDCYMQSYVDITIVLHAFVELCGHNCHSII